MSAREAIEARAVAEWRDWLLEAAQAQGIPHANALATKLYGRNAKGKAKSSGRVSAMLRAELNLRIESFKMLSEALQVPLEEVRERYTKARTGRLLVGPVQPRAVAVQLEAPLAPPPPPPPPPAAPPDQFSLVIDHGGTATLRLNMVGVPMNAALRAMAALTGAGLISTPGDKDNA